MKTLSIIKTSLLVAGILLASNANGDNKRRGFNFGTSVGIDSSNDRTSSKNAEGTSLHTTGSEQSYSPYLGYSFSGVFNLGLSFGFAEKTNNEVEKSAAGLVLNDRNSTASTKSASLFSRFLFGRILFFEVGVGYYSEETKIKNTLSISHEGERIQGTVEDYSVKGAGIGYHLGGGFEIPTGAGFYFTGAFLNKIYNIKGEGNNVNGKNAYQQKRVLTFGLAHYYK